MAGKILTYRFSIAFQNSQKGKLPPGLPSLPQVSSQTDDLNLNLCSGSVSRETPQQDYVIYWKDPQRGGKKAQVLMDLTSLSLSFVICNKCHNVAWVTPVCDKGRDHHSDLPGPWHHLLMGPERWVSFSEQPEPEPVRSWPCCPDPECCSWFRVLTSHPYPSPSLYLRVAWHFYSIWPGGGRITTS